MSTQNKVHKKPMKRAFLMPDSSAFGFIFVLFPVEAYCILPDGTMLTISPAASESVIVPSDTSTSDDSKAVPVLFTE